MNKLLGQKISITLPQSANNSSPRCGESILKARIRQSTLIPAPAYGRKRAINRLMNKAASSSIGDVELRDFVVEGTRWTPDDEMVLNKLRDGEAPVILAVNKIDNVQEKAICCRTYSSWQVRSTSSISCRSLLKPG
ncbi:hypothetical protein ACLK19_17150 [Escherichia coli]